MVVNIPVKLVRADGQLIALDVDRNINPHPIPYAGSNRFAFDLNMSKAVILLEGYMVDAPTVVDATAGSKAVSYIDFARTLSGSSTLNFDWIDDYVVLENAYNAVTDSFIGQNGYDIPRLDITDINDVTYSINFIKSNTTYGHDLGTSGKYHVSIIDASGNLRTTANIQTYLTALLNENSGSSILGTKFSAVAQGAGGVQIKQISNGKAGNNNSPRFTHTQNTPYFFTFITGKDSDSLQGLSAGDKVMSLYAILNNSVDVDNSEKNYTRSNFWGGKIGERMDDKMIISGDYITGIQIPFNSTVNADGEKYKAMNFFMPTGKGYGPTTKGVQMAQPASSVIDDPDASNDFSFIKGTITKATFVQIGGEPIYQFNIQFLPIDVII